MQQLFIRNNNMPMLDELLLKAKLAFDRLSEQAQYVPTDEQLREIKRSDEFTHMTLDACWRLPLYVVKERHDDIVEFCQLLACVLWYKREGARCTHLLTRDERIS